MLRILSLILDHLISHDVDWGKVKRRLIYRWLWPVLAVIAILLFREDSVILKLLGAAAEIGAVIFIVKSNKKHTKDTNV